MTEEIDFFDLEKADIQDNLNSQIPNLNKVIMKVLHTRTEIKIYPNGTCFQQSRSWFEDKQYEVKPKPKKELIMVKKLKKK